MKGDREASNGKFRILEIGGYPPPNTGWSVRIKFLREGFIQKGVECQVLNLGRNRRIKSPDYIDVQDGVDFLKKLICFCRMGYCFHVHMNGQAVKGPILALIAQLISVLFGRRPALTFHGGTEQLFFPKRNAGKMYWIIYLNFLLAKVIVCNNIPVKKLIVAYGARIDAQKIVPIPAFSVQYLDFRTVQLPDNIFRFINTKKHVIVCYIVLRNGFFVDTTVAFLKRCGPDIGVILTGIDAPEDDEVAGYLETIERLASKGTVLAVNDLAHDAFMTLLHQCRLYLRTPVSDGVASSVLEALAQRVPVVASDNGRRPASVLVYSPADPQDLMEKVQYVLHNYETVKQSIAIPEVEDTLVKEMMILEGYLAW